ncbi:MAG: hypothetical protein GY731_00485 [Gammaproteobacteria bacterium]|nr:hypothetical protein [Gammaproteobacteria bacterium]
MTALEHHPFNPDVRLQVLALSCGSGDITPEQLSLTGKALVGTRYTSAVIRGFQNLIRLKRLNSCAALSHQELLALIDTTLANPGLIYEYGIQGDLYYLKGLAYISSGEKKKAIEAFNQAFTVAPLVDIGMQIVGVLATNQEYVAAKEVLHMVEIKLGERAGKGEGLVFFYQSLLQRGQQQYGAEIERIRKELDNDIALSKTQAK